MGIDWSKAPEGATHWHPCADGYVEHWIKPGFFCTTGFESEGWKVTHNDTLTFAVPRPAKAPTWNGEGLPPVGTMCEFRGIDTYSEWQRVEILLHFQANSAMVAVFYPLSGNRIVNQAVACCFRPIKTPEQAAAEERAAAVAEMVEAKIAGGLAPWVCGELYDAGYRKVPAND